MDRVTGGLLGPVLIVGGLLLLAGFTIAARRGFKPALRPLRGYEALPRQIGQVVEAGGRLHVSLGPNSLTDREAGATLAGLAMLELAARASTLADRPPLATTADGATVWAMSDALRRAYTGKGEAETGTGDQPTGEQGAFLVALDPTALAGGVTSLIPSDGVRASVLFGSFGSEVALMAEAGHRAGIPQTVGSDRLEAQAAGYAMADNVLIGEEMFAARAYLDARPAALGGLLAQDVLRWVVAGLIGLGVVLQTLGLLN